MKSILERTSVRQYTDKKLSDEDVKAILRAAFAAPSARDLRPWYFIVIRDEKKLEEISRFSPYASFLKEAAMGIVVCCDLSRNPRLDYCQQDCAAATQNMLIEAKERGIGTCWLGGYPNDERVVYLRDALQIEEPLMPLWAVSFGYPAVFGKVTDKWEDNVIRYL